MEDKTQCILHSKKLEEMRLDIKAILKLLNGNGKIGVCAKINILWGSAIFLIGGVVAALIRSFLK